MPDESNSINPASSSGTGPNDDGGTNGSAGALSPEEQMEQYEEDLKETDWGHQPC